MAVKFETISPAANAQRVTRSPRHTFNLITRPWQIQPFLIAPVLPGETLKSFLHQSRTVSKPVLSPLVGWWLEHYYFYVKLRDLDDRATIESMMLDVSTSTVAMQTAASTYTYHPASTIDWVFKCEKRVVEEFFRVDGESYSAGTIDGVPTANLGIRHWSESATNEDPYLVPDLNVDLNANATITASEVQRALQQWTFMQQNKLTEMTFEDYLRAFGIRVPDAQEPYRPELIRFFRDWAYPTNHVSPTTGTPSSALVWTTQDRGDKDRFFIEPGFIFAVQVARPKIYLSRQSGAGASMMDSALSWIPPQYINNRAVSMKRFAAGAYPLPSNTDDYWIDVQDLLLHGDQFLNYSLATTGTNLVALPGVTDPDLSSVYPSATHADTLFAAASPANTLATDGVVDLHIATRLKDQT